MKLASKFFREGQRLWPLKYLKQLINKIPTYKQKYYVLHHDSEVDLEKAVLKKDWFKSYVYR